MHAVWYILQSPLTSVLTDLKNSTMAEKKHGNNAKEETEAQEWQQLPHITPMPGEPVLEPPLTSLNAFALKIVIKYSLLLDLS